MKFSTLLPSVLLVFAASLAEAAVRTQPPAGAVVVSKNPSAGQFGSLQGAINSLSLTSTAPQTIFIYPGTYTEQVYIAQRTARLTIYGSSTDTTSYLQNTVTITQGKSRDSEPNNDGTGTVRARAAGLRIYNVNIVNSRGMGTQAIALSAQATEQGYYGVKLVGYQDTLLANVGNQIYAGGYIDGAVDFIFGQKARVWFDNIDIRIKGKGWVTANGRDSEANPSYYLFNSCEIDVAAGVTLSAGSTYLGRPWRSFSRVVFQNTYMPSIVNQAGWSTWAKDTPNTASVYYKEWKNYGTGAGTSTSRAKFSGKLTAAKKIETVLGSNYGSWVDKSYL